MTALTTDFPTVRAAVLDVARRELALPDDELARLTDTSELASHLDSVQRLTLVVGIEDHFQICMDPEDDAQAVTLADVVHIVMRHLAAP